MKKNAGHIDWYILLPVVGLMLFSIGFVYSASASLSELKFGFQEKYFINQLIRIISGLLIIIIFAKIDYHAWKKFSLYLLIISIILLFFVLIGGHSSKGAARWIHLGFINFQPSEFAKFALVLHFAYLLEKKQEKIKDFKSGFLPFIVWASVICILIAAQPHFSTTLVIYLIAISMMFIGNCNLVYLLSTTSLGLLIAGIYGVSASYRLNRLMAYFGMGSESSASETVKYQLQQALIAIGDGGIIGVGPGQSRQAHLFLPESYGDFIFSIIGEEYGFIGAGLIIAIFIIIFWRGMIIAKKAPDNFGYFLAVGILITFAIYVFVNAGVNCGLLPTTGVPMPFVSYGGSAIFIYAAAIGILLNISAQAGVYPRNEEIPASTN